MSVTVSVLIAAFNAEAFVGNAVRSALGQTMPDIEVIVVDDGSQDATAAAAEAAAAGDPRFRLFKLATNAGAAVARNVALRAAVGQWVSILDADDTFAPERLERLVGQARALHADLLADNLTLCYPDSRLVRGFAVARRDRTRPMDASRLIARDRPGLGQLPMGYMQPVMRRTFLCRFDLRYAEDISCGEDFDLYVRCLLRGGRLFMVRESYYHCTVRPGSLSRSNQERNMAVVIRSNDRLIPEARRLGKCDAASMLERRSRALRSYVEYSRLSDALHGRRFRDALRAFFRVFPRWYTWQRFGLAAKRRLTRGHAT